MGSGILATDQRSTMSRRLTYDVTASLAARALSGGLQFVFTPIYVGLLGIESYGLVGFYLVLIGTLLFLDQAVSPVFTRHFAAAAHDDRRRAQLPDALRTMELLSVGSGLVVAAIVVLAAPLLARELLNSSSIDPAHNTAAVRMMAVMVAVQWPSFAYGGALAGMHRQIQLNGVRAAVALAQWGGGALMLWWQTNVFALFAWQAVCFSVQTLVLRALVHRSIGQSDVPARFDRMMLAESWRFGFGALLIGITGTVLTQADKIVVMRHSPLADFSVYSLSFTVASIIQVFVAQPVMSIAYPHFALLVAAGDQQRLSSEYLRWTQAVILVVVPITAVFVIFPDAVLEFWLTKHPAALPQARQYLPWIALGTMFNVIMMLPLNLQFANGWTSLSSIKNVLLIPPFLMVLLLAIPAYGPVVGAICWLGINLSYYLAEIPIMHRRLLKTDLWRWWITHTAVPMAVVGAIFFCVHLASRTVLTQLPVLLAAAIAWLIATLLLVALLPFTRELLLRKRSLP